MYFNENNCIFFQKRDNNIVYIFIVSSGSVQPVHCQMSCSFQKTPLYTQEKMRIKRQIMCSIHLTGPLRRHPLRKRGREGTILQEASMEAETSQKAVAINHERSTGGLGCSSQCGEKQSCSGDNVKVDPHRLCGQNGPGCEKIKSKFQVSNQKN